MSSLEKIRDLHHQIQEIEKKKRCTTAYASGVRAAYDKEIEELRKQIEKRKARINLGQEVTYLQKTV